MEKIENEKKLIKDYDGIGAGRDNDHARHTIVQKGKLK